jgi:hypothetical protein
VQEIVARWSPSRRYLCVHLLTPMNALPTPVSTPLVGYHLGFQMMWNDEFGASGHITHLRSISNRKTSMS